MKPRTYQSFSTFVLFCFLYLSSTCLKAQWERVLYQTGGNGNALAKIENRYFLGTNVGLYISEDEAESWHPIEGFENRCVYEIYSQGDTLYVFYTVPDLNQPLDYTAFLTMSPDKGIHWEIPVFISRNLNEYPYFNTFFSNSKLYHLDNYCRGFVSDDFGNSWYRFSIELDEKYLRFKGQNSDGILVQSEIENEVYFYNFSDESLTLVPVKGSYLKSFLIGEFIFIIEYYPKDGNVIRKIDVNNLSATDISIIPDKKFRAESLVLFDDKLYLYNYTSYSVSEDFGENWSNIKHDLMFQFQESVFLNSGAILYTIQTYGVFKTDSINTQSVKSDNGLYETVIHSNHRDSENNLYLLNSHNLMQSQDTGKSWRILMSNVTEIISSAFSKDTLAFLLRIRNEGTNIIVSTDGGDHFVTRRLENTIGYKSSIVFWKNQLVLETGYELLMSPDLGDTWTQIPTHTNPNYPFDECTYTSTVSGYLAVVDEELFIIHTNGLFKFVQTDQHWDYIFCIKSNSGSARDYFMKFGQKYLLIKANSLFTSDDGISFTQPLGNVTQDVDDWSKSIGYIDYANGAWLTTKRDHGVVYSFDQGNNWTLLNSNYPFIPNGRLAAIGNKIFLPGEYNGLWSHPLNYSNAKGFVYWDKNENNNPDFNDIPVSGVELSGVNQGFNTHTDNFGFYNLLTNFPNDTIKLLGLSAYVKSVPPYHIYQNSIGQYNFALTVDSNILDGSVTLEGDLEYILYNQGRLVCEVKNKGAKPSQFNVTLEIDPRLDIYFALDSHVSVNRHTITWTTPELGLEEKHTTEINLGINIEKHTDSLYRNTASIENISGDVNPDNNLDSFNFRLYTFYRPPNDTLSQIISKNSNTELENHLKSNLADKENNQSENFVKDLIKFNVSPNPASNSISLDYPLIPHESYTFTTHDNMGQRVLQQTISGEGNFIDLENLPSGTYFGLLRDKDFIPVGICRFIIVN